MKISYEKFEALRDDSTDYEETEVDGREVMVCYDSEAYVVAVYYRKAGFASYAPEYKTKDFIAFVEMDPDWPYGD